VKKAVLFNEFAKIANSLLSLHKIIHMDTISISKKILEAIKNVQETKYFPAELLSELLHISTDAAYRRLSGKVDLTLEEAAKLCSQYNLSIDNLTSLSNKKISFDYFALFNEYFTDSYTVYLTALESSLQEVITTNGNIFVAAADIPIGFLLRYPKLMAFKLYCWRNDMVGPNKQVLFTTKAELNPYSQFFSRFPKLYEKANSIELWCKQTFSSFIESLTFYKELSLIPDEALSILKNNLHDLLKDVESFANEGNKGGGGRFELYLSPLTLANSIFLLDRNDKMTSFLKMYSINSIWTSNTLYCSEQKKWFEALINSSTKISGSGMKERKRFFEDIHNQVDNIQ
jgi:hypothetical protein